MNIKFEKSNTTPLHLLEMKVAIKNSSKMPFNIAIVCNSLGLRKARFSN